MAGSLHQCAECGYTTMYEGASCPLCSGTKWQVAEPSPSRAADFNPHTFSLSTLFLIMSLICVSLGAIVAVPGLGVPLVILGVPALVRTSAATCFLRGFDGRWSTGERIAHFASSLGLMFGIGIAGVIAFQLACWTSCWGVAAAGGGESAAFMTGLWVGGGAGAWAIGWLLWRTWPKRER